MGTENRSVLLPREKGGRGKLFGMMGNGTSYIICGAQYKMKMQGPCSKMIKKFKTVRGKHYTKHRAL